MSGIYYCPLENLSVTNDSDQDVFELTAGANDKLVLLGFELYSAAIAAEAVRMRLVRRTTAGSGGTGEPENDADEGNTTTATAACVSLATTPGSAGDVLQAFQWEQLGPLIYSPTPEQYIKVQEGGRIALNLLTALNATTVMDGWVCWQEL
jgi:hypothetical protein